MIDEILFDEWIEDGNVCKIDEDKYIEQTTQWRIEFTLDELRKFYIKEFLQD
jgi:hypothetical protein